MYLVPRTLPSRNLQLQLCFKAYRNHRLLFRLNGMDIDTFGFPKELNGNIAVFFKKKKLKKMGRTLHYMMHYKVCQIYVERQTCLIPFRVHQYIVYAFIA